MVLKWIYQKLPDEQPMCNDKLLGWDESNILYYESKCVLGKKL